MRAGHSYIHTNKLTCMHTYINTYGVKEKQMSHLPLTNPPTPPPPHTSIYTPTPGNGALSAAIRQRIEEDRDRSVFPIFFCE
jgi:hypothetical protein